MAQAKALHPEFPRRFFNVGFVLDPDGQLVLRHHKVVPLLPVEHSSHPTMSLTDGSSSMARRSTRSTLSRTRRSAAWGS